MLLSPTAAARVLGVTLTDWERAALSDFGLSPDVGRRLEYAARTRAVEHYPIDAPQCAPCGEAGVITPANWRAVWVDEEGEDEEATSVCDACLAAGSDDGHGYRAEPGERFDLHDGGKDGCPPAAARHVLAGALVASLATGLGFPYGCPPADTDADEWRIPGPLSRDQSPRPVAEGYPVDVRLYPAAEAVCELALGMLPARDDEAVRDQAPDELHVAVVDLAIDILADRDHTVAEIACGFAAWMLATWRENWAVARARRIVAFVGRRFEVRP